MNDAAGDDAAAASRRGGDAEPAGRGVWARLPRPVQIAVIIVALGVLAALALQLREPEVAFDPPERPAGAHVHDPAGAVDDEAVEQRLAELADASGVDAVVVVWEDDQSSRGQAARGAQRILEAWQADVALSAVAMPGAFDDPQAGERYFGVEGDRFTVSADLRERIVAEVEQARPASSQAWTDAFLAVIDVLAADLAGQ